MAEAEHKDEGFELSLKSNLFVAITRVQQAVPNHTPFQLAEYLTTKLLTDYQISQKTNTR